MLQALEYPEVVPKQTQPNFRVRLPQKARNDVTAWCEKMGTTDVQVAERVLGWFANLPEMLQLAIWREWKVPPDSDMAKAILASLKPSGGLPEGTGVAVVRSREQSPVPLPAPDPTPPRKQTDTDKPASRRIMR